MQKAKQGKRLNKTLTLTFLMRVCFYISFIKQTINLSRTCGVKLIPFLNDVEVS